MHKILPFFIVKIWKEYFNVFSYWNKKSKLQVIINKITFNLNVFLFKKKVEIIKLRNFEFTCKFIWKLYLILKQISIGLVCTREGLVQNMLFE